MKPVVISVPEQNRLGEALAYRLDAEVADAHIRSFPDGETYVRIDSPVDDRLVIVASSLTRPNDRFLPLYMIAESARDLGAGRVGLVAPYLSYMRQDDRFQPGEGITSQYFAQLLSQTFDWLVTVEPHLHRRGALESIYSIPTRIVRAAGPIAGWIEDNVDDPILVGPDAESEQWVSPIAEVGGFPSVVLDKVRRGDYDVDVEAPASVEWGGRQPVLIDDIISTGGTMVEAVHLVVDRQLPPPVCIGIHGLFVGDALERLEATGVRQIVTCNTVSHPTNAIDICGGLAEGVEKMIGDEVAVAVVSNREAGKASP